jgi:glutathione synthase/RimK-type ligase-like ATP-grasp enzyme
MVFNPALRSAYIPDNGIYVDVIKFFLEHGKVVVKPNDGSQGMNVFCCSTIKEVETAIQKIFRTQPSLSICPFYQIDTEYRTFVLNGEVKLIYGKTKPEVVGDGVSTLGQLVEKLNLPQKSVAEENVRALDLSYVPAEGERVQISWKFNLSGGATPKVLEKGELYSRVEELALKAAHAANAKFATIDVIQDTDGNLWVLEINSGVCGTIFIDHIEGGYEIIKSIYSEAIDEMFK